MNNLVFDRIGDLPPENRPRERLAARGVTALSDLELLTLMIGSGQGNRGVGKLAADLLSVLDVSTEIPDISELTGIEGIGPARASLITASLEFSRRRLRPSRRRVGKPGDIIPLVAHWADRPQEHFLSVSLNGAHEVIRVRVISRGTIDRTIVHPREVFIDPLSDRAAAILVAHNHPSGSLVPSPEDKELTRRLSSAGELLGIPLLDHVIFTDVGYYSFLEHGGMD